MYGDNGDIMFTNKKRDEINQKLTEHQQQSVALAADYRCKLSRKGVTPQNTEELLGYNYYLLGYINQELKKQEFIYSSLYTSNPLNLEIHDLNAKKIYDKRVSYISGTPPSDQTYIYEPQKELPSGSSMLSQYSKRFDAASARNADNAAKAFMQGNTPYTRSKFLEQSLDRDDMNDKIFRMQVNRYNPR